MSQSRQAATALVVEDQEQNAYILKHMLSREGFHVDVAADGRKAVEYISSQSAPSIVLLDIMLPYLDGYELTQLIRAHPKWRNVPVIILSGRSQEQDVVRALSSGANDFVPKPYSHDELLARVNLRIAESERMAMS